MPKYALTDIIIIIKLMSEWECEAYKIVIFATITIAP